MTAPLVARGEVLGAVSFVTSASGRIFTDSDLGTGEELASRAAIALDNARLYAREQRIALTLQRSLLPSRFPATPALEIAAVYHPAAQDGPVGGDWYDVIALPCGRVGLVMGDVMGRGVPAAALMGQLRAAVRAYAAQDLTPSELLGHLDDLVRGLADDVIVTCIYAVYDPVSSALCLANAGHPPPLLVTPNGAQRIDQHGVVLGAGHANYEQTEIPVDEGTTLVLYTDGLVERRTADLDACIDDLARLAAAQTGNLQQLSTRIATLAVEGPDADDVAVMVVRPLAGQAPRVARFDVVPHARMVRDVRQFADHALTDWGETQATHEAVQLIVSELVTNVIRHADGHEATVQLERHADRIVVSVIDPDGAPPRLARPGPEDEGGRGLHLVQAVTDRWGTRSLPDGGKVVWCELFVSGLAT
jgi:anti-sigma regulatory factor (Ser/Thr protein kinase)